MFVELGCIAAGVPLGFTLRRTRGILHAVDFLLTWSVRVLLFLLGLALGADADIITQLEVLGLHAAVISLCAMAGSLLVARWLSGILHVHKPGGEAVPSSATKSTTEPAA